MSIYDTPELYALAFEHRDFESEVAFLIEANALFGWRGLRRVLEVGAGHAPHAGCFSKQGIQYLGLELHPRMLESGKRHWDGDPNISLIEGDMNQFSLSESVDMVFVMLGSLYYKTSDELLTHLQSVARVLNTSGLYILDSCVQFADPLAQGTTHEFSHETEQGTIRSRFEIELVDPITQLYKERWEIDLHDIEGKKQHAESIEYNRALYPQEFRLLVEKQGNFEIAGMFGSWSLNNPIRSGSSVTRPVIILRKLPDQISKSA
jgi:ubiquinone/menaquinone biosynthesis C-methylase UbiE